MDPLLVKLNELFKSFRSSRDIDPDTIAIYYQRLTMLPEGAVCAAIDRLIDTSRFLPTIAEIKESAVVGAWGEIADEAWAEVQREARRVGYNRPPVFRNGQFEPSPVPTFSNETVALAANSVGWEAICCGDDSKGFVRSQFIKAFTAFRERETKAKQAGVIPMTETALPAGVTSIERGAA